MSAVFAWPIPWLKIGLIEAYPFSSADAIETMVQLLRARGVPPAFLHMDVDWHALMTGDFARDMKRLQALPPPRTFHSASSSSATTAKRMRCMRSMRPVSPTSSPDAFQTWDAMPQHLIFQSWVSRRRDCSITPSQPPWRHQLYTHTSLVWDLFRAASRRHRRKHRHRRPTRTLKHLIEDPAILFANAPQHDS